MPKRASLKGKGPDLLGKGIDLLFGAEDAGETEVRRQNGNHGENSASVAGFAPPTSLPQLSELVVDLGGQDLDLEIPPLPVGPTETAEVTTGPAGGQLAVEPASDMMPGVTPTPGAVDEATVVAHGPVELDDGFPQAPADDWGGTTPVADPTAEAPPAPSPISSLEEGIPPEPVADAQPVTVPDAVERPEPPNSTEPTALEEGIPPLPVDLPQPEVGSGATTAVAEDSQAGPTPQPAASAEAPTEPTTMPEQPIASSGRPETSPPTNGTGVKEEVPVTPKPVNEPRKVGAPGVTVSGPVTTAAGTQQETQTPAQQAAEMLTRPKEALSDADAREILRRVQQRDLEKLDRDIDKLYDKTVELLSGEDEAVIAFEALRKARQMLLLEPEQVAEVEYLVNRIRSMLTRVEQAATWGPYYGPRILAYQVVWLVLFGVFALVTTVPETGFARWIAYWIGVQAGSATVNLITLLLSTLAWGGIGGVTGALWSLHYHVSVVRDFDKAENLWYIEQPILGMVLGGIVYLIMAAGFLVVQVDLSAPQAALGAKLLPAAVAVVAGFRQNLVLDLIDRVVSLLVPGKDRARPSESSTPPTI